MALQSDLIDLCLQLRYQRRMPECVKRIEAVRAFRALYEAGDKAAAFEMAHALKGVLGNLALTPIYKPLSEMTELLRAGKDPDADGGRFQSASGE